MLTKIPDRLQSYPTLECLRRKHISFHPSKPFVYAVQELTGSVTVLSFKNGELKKVQQINMFDQVTDKNQVLQIFICRPMENFYMLPIEQIIMIWPFIQLLLMVYSLGLDHSLRLD